MFCSLCDAWLTGSNRTDRASLPRLWTFRPILFQKIFQFSMSSSVDIDAPRSRVWSAIKNAAEWPRWSNVCTDVWDVPASGIGEVGSKFGFRLRMGGRKVPFNVTVSRVVADQLIEWRSTKFSITAVRTISIETQGDGCRVVDTKSFKSPFLPIGIAYPRWLITRMTNAWLDELKIESERTS